MEVFKKLYRLLRAEWVRETRDHPVATRIALIWVPIVMVLYTVMVILSRK